MESIGIRWEGTKSVDEKAADNTMDPLSRLGAEIDADFGAAQTSEAGTLPGAMPVVRYMVSEYAPLYRLILDVLLEEEAMLGLHLPTAQIEQRVQSRLKGRIAATDMPDMEDLLGRLYSWGNVDRTHNTHRKGTAAEYLKRDYLYQLTPPGAEVHQTLRRIDSELGSTGALQSSMLPEVLNALHELCNALVTGESGHRGIDLRASYAALQRIIGGFTQLAENSKRFVQGLNTVMENGTSFTDEVFIAYKDEVVLYLRTFVMTLVRYSAPIANAINEAETRGLHLHLLDLAHLEAAPTLGLSMDEVAERDAAVLHTQWEGLRSWFFGDEDRLPITTALQDRAADAVSRIVSIVRRFNERRFRRVDRTTDLLILAEWFTGTDDANARASLWRNAFGMYSARHFGTPHDATGDLDTRPNSSWWETAPAPIELRLRTQGPRASSGRPNQIPNPRAAKRRLAGRRAAEQEARERAISRLAELTPARISEFPALDTDATDLLLVCLRTVLAVRKDGSGTQRVRTGDGRLLIMVQPCCDPDGTVPSTVLKSTRGAIAMDDFNIDIVDLVRGEA
jgi:uncharacterized protein (TIGR02677 family)